MDITLIRKKLLEWGNKYKYVVVVLAIGILFMLLPGGTKDTDQQPNTSPLKQESIQLEITAEQLEKVLSRIEGAGEVDVLLTYSAGKRTVFQKNERITTSEGGGSQEYETVLLTDNSRTESPLTVQERAPEYLGAVIVCQGAENPSVKLAVSEAVSKATGLGTDRISVLKMK